MAGAPAPGSSPASYPYAHPALLNDITSGSNGPCLVPKWCTAGPGYDGPTGEGTPAAVLPFTSTGTVSGEVYNEGVGVTAGKCMDNASNSTTNGNKVQVWTCLGDAAQHWTWEPSGKIETGNGMCLGIQGGISAPAGSNVISWSCASGGQKWLPSSSQRLTDGTLNMCLGVNSAGNDADGTQLWINTCDSDATQQWTMPYPVPTSTGAITSQAINLCIGQINNSSIDQLWINDCSTPPSPTQDWTVEANGSISNGNGDCMDAHDAGTATGTPVDAANCSTGPAQQWQILSDGSLRNPESGLCVATHDGDTTAETPLVLGPCSPYPATQEWNLPTLSS